MRSLAKPLHEAGMTSREVQIAQNEHYALDDEMRRMMEMATPEQKRKAIDTVRAILKEKP